MMLFLFLHHLIESVFGLRDALFALFDQLLGLLNVVDEFVETGFAIVVLETFDNGLYLADGFIVGEGVGRLSGFVHDDGKDV